MKIENSNLNAIPFEQISVGDTFMIDNDINIYMKMEMVKDTVLGALNAVDISDGCSTLCYDDTIVHPIEGKFVVERVW